MRDGVRALIVGAGLMGRWHAHAIRRTGGTVVGIVDSDPARSAALARRHGGAPRFGELEPALAAVSPEVVHLCTPLASHVRLATAALTAGHHVLVEKPLAPSAADTRRLFELANARGRFLVPVHQFGFQPGVLRLRERLPDLGAVIHVQLATASAGAEQPGLSAESVVADILPHFLGLGRDLLEGSLLRYRWTVVTPREGEWRVTGDREGQSLGFLISMAARPSFAELRMLAQNGSALVDLFHGFAVFEPGGTSRRRKLLRPFGLTSRTFLAAAVNLAGRGIRREPAYPGLTELIRRVHRAARGQGVNPIPPEAVLEIAEARDLLLAHAGGRTSG